MNRTYTYNATLYQGNRRCRALVENGVLLDTSAIHCTWSGTARFQAWFLQRFGPCEVVKDGRALVYAPVPKVAA